MTNPLLAKVAEAIIAEYDYYSPPESLAAIILQYASRAQPDVSEIEFMDTLLSDINKREIISILLKHQQNLKKSGVFAAYEINDETEIVGFSFPRPIDTELMAKVRMVAPELPNIIEALRKLNPDNFEHFCKRLLDLLSGEDTMKTSQSNDGGVDFLGWLRIPETLAKPGEILGFRSDFYMLVLGQAKKYKPENPIGVSCIRELVGTISSFHHDQLAPWESKFQVPRITLMSPMLGLLMTTGKISKDARTLAANCGIIVKDGAEIALFIALEGVGMNRQVNEDGIASLVFDESRFLEWLAA